MSFPFLPSTSTGAPPPRRCPPPLWRRAALVLPCQSLLERGEILGAYGHHWIQLAQPVLEAPAGVRSDLEIVQELARRLGLGDALAGTWRDWADRLIRDEMRRVFDAYAAGWRDGK